MDFVQLLWLFKKKNIWFVIGFCPIAEMVYLFLL